MPDDERYYIRCPRRKNNARLAIAVCLKCEFVTGSVEQGYVGIGCGFPNRQKPIQRPKVKRIARDGVL